MKAAIYGWNGMKNVGDDAMTLVIVEQLAKVSSTIFIIANKNKNSLSYLEPYQDKINFKFPVLYNFFRKTPGLGGIYYRYFLSVYMVFKYDLIVIGGGSIFHSSGINKFYKNLLRINKLFRLKRKIVAIGVSIGPFKDTLSKKIFNEMAGEFSYLSVRDSRSYNFCRAIGGLKDVNLNYSPDLALAIPVTRNISVEKKQQIGIILRQGYVNAKVTHLLDRIIEYVINEFPTTGIVFHSFCELDNPNENDLFAIQEYLRLKPKSIVDKVYINRYDSDPVSFYRALKESKLNICMRLHGSIISYGVDTPFIMLSYHQKCVDFFQDMNLDSRFLIQDYKDADLIFTLLAEFIGKDAAGAVLNSEVKQQSLNHFNFLANRASE